MVCDPNSNFVPQLYGHGGLRANLKDHVKTNSRKVNCKLQEYSLWNKWHTPKDADGPSSANTTGVMSKLFERLVDIDKIFV